MWVLMGCVTTTQSTRLDDVTTMAKPSKHEYFNLAYELISVPHAGLARSLHVAKRIDTEL